MSEQTELCQNCNKHFPSEKIATHFGYCRRNIKRCTECGEMYDINYKEEHEEEFHKKVKCEYCKVEVKAGEIQRHKIGCSRRSQFCQYCQLNVPIAEYQVHLKGCQARTKQCDKCRKAIVNKDYLVHLTTCKGITQQPPKSYNQYLKNQRPKQTRQMPREVSNQQARPQYVRVNYQPEIKTQVDQRKILTNDNGGSFGSYGRGKDYGAGYQGQSGATGNTPVISYTGNTGIIGNKVQPSSSSNNKIIYPSASTTAKGTTGTTGTTTTNLNPNPYSNQTRGNQGSNLPQSNINNYTNNYNNPTTYARKEEKPVTTTTNTSNGGTQQYQYQGAQNKYGVSDREKERQNIKPQIKVYEPSNRNKYQQSNTNNYAASNNRPVDNIYRKQTTGTSGGTSSNSRQVQYQYNQPTSNYPSSKQQDNKRTVTYTHGGSTNPSTNLNPNPYSQNQKKQKQKIPIFDPREYGGYQNQIPKQLGQPNQRGQRSNNQNYNNANTLAIEQDEEMQKAIMESMGIVNAPKNGGKASNKNLPKEFQSVDPMEQSFINDWDVEKQRAIMEQFQKNKKRR